MGTFDQRVCVITGAGSGIGKAAAELFAREGSHVVLADIADATELATSLGGTYIRTDVSDEGSVENLISQTTAKHGRVEVLINNAGIMTGQPIDRLERPEFYRHIDINTLGIVYGMKHAARAMPAGSAIVNTASMAGVGGVSTYGAYSASKAAVMSLTQVAALEYGPRGIRVNCICPSSVETPMLQGQAGGDIEREISRMASPLGITITPEQVADVIAFLASSASSAVTGQALNVDAGMSAGYSDEILEAIASTLTPKD